MDVHSKWYIGKGHSLRSLDNRAHDVTLRTRKNALEKHCLSCSQDKGGVRGGRIFQIKSQAGTESPGLGTENMLWLTRGNKGKGRARYGWRAKGHTTQSQGGGLRGVRKTLLSSKNETKPNKEVAIII